MAAINALNQMEEIDGISTDTLAAALNVEEDFRAAWTYWKATGDADKVLPTLRNALKSADNNDRAEAVLYLGEMGSLASPAINDLEQLAENDSDQFVRDQARFSLDKMTRDKSGRASRRNLAPQDPIILSSDDAQYQQSDRKKYTLSKAMNDLSSTHSEKQLKALRYFSKHKSRLPLDCIPTVSKLLTHPAGSIRLSAAGVLSEHEPRESRRVVQEALESKNPDLVNHALVLLSTVKMNTEQTVARLKVLIQQKGPIQLPAAVALWRLTEDTDLVMPILDEASAFELSSLKDMIRSIRAIAPLLVPVLLKTFVRSGPTDQINLQQIIAKIDPSIDPYALLPASASEVPMSPSTRAIADWTEALLHDPNDLQAYRCRGQAYFELKQYSQALSDWAEALKRHPADLALLEQRASAHLQQSDYEAAILDYDQMLRLAPENAEHWISRGVAHRRVGMFDSAIADYTQALSLEPHSVKALRFRAFAHRCRGDYASSRSDLEEGYRLDPDDLLILNDLIWQFSVCSDSAHRDGSRALAFAQQAIERGGDRHPEILDTLACAYSEAGRFPEAITTVGRAIELGVHLPVEVQQEFVRHLKLFQEGQPYRMPTPSTLLSKVISEGSGEL